MKLMLDIAATIIISALYAVAANSYFILGSAWHAVLAVLVISAIILIPFSSNTLLRKIKTKSARRLRFLEYGTRRLYVFLLSTAVSVSYHVYLLIKGLPFIPAKVIFSALVAFAAEAVIFASGISLVYLTSIQLGIKYRVLGVCLGLIPIVNVFVLIKIMRVCRREIVFESKKERLNEERKHQKLCKTRYPVLLVHGVCFRDYKHFGYWGRIPNELERNGATVYFGNHQSAISVKSAAEELTARIKEIISESGCEKVNVIAHSKGGLDIRYAIKHLGAAPMIASLTTVSTPHRGCIYAEYLFETVPDKTRERIAAGYNGAATVLGDSSPDFIAAMRDLVSSKCAVFDKELTVPEDIFCQSFGSCLGDTADGKFPFNLTYFLVKKFDGPNDGLVSETAFSFGERYKLWKSDCGHGITHCDTTDLYRFNLPGFDVREEYVKIVSDLKDRGL